MQMNMADCVEWGKMEPEPIFLLLAIVFGAYLIQNLLSESLHPLNLFWGMKLFRIVNVFLGADQNML